MFAFSTTITSLYMTQEKHLVNTNYIHESLVLVYAAHRTGLGRSKTLIAKSTDVDFLYGVVEWLTTGT